MHCSSSGLRWRSRLARISSGVIHSVRTMPCVERAAGIVRAQRAAEGEAQVGDVVARRGVAAARHVHADQRASGVKWWAVSSSASRTQPCDRRLARVEVAGRVVELQAVAGSLLDQQEAAVALDDGGDGDVGFPADVHGGRLSAAPAAAHALRFHAAPKINAMAHPSGVAPRLRRCSRCGSPRACRLDLPPPHRASRAPAA